MAVESKLDRIIQRIHDLMALADHPNTPVNEADNARSFAEKLMTEYKVEESHLAEQSPGAPTLSPQWRTFVICNARSEFLSQYKAMASYIVNHLGIRAVFMRVANEDYSGENYVAEMVGYESDLRFADVMYTQAQVTFQSKLEPKYDPAKSDQENAYIMRSAGMEGWRIAQAIFGRDDRSLRPKVRGMFKAEAIKRGEDPTILLGKGNSVKTFRDSYAQGFVDQIYHMLYQMRLARTESAVGLVLASREEAINEAFYQRYPQYRPASNQHKAAAYRDPREGCQRCKAAKSGYCREHNWLKPRYGRPAPVNYAARERGVNAARSVDFSHDPGRGKMEGKQHPQGEIGGNS